MRSLLIIRDPPSRRHPGGGQSDRLADAVVSAAAARIGDLGVDLRISRIWAFVKQRHNAHDHARLAVATLRYVEIDPGELHGMRPIRRQAFDGGHRLTDRGRDRNAAGANRLTVDVQSAGAALGNAAAEFGTCRAQADRGSPRAAEFQALRRLNAELHSL